VHQWQQGKSRTGIAVFVMFSAAKIMLLFQILNSPFCVICSNGVLLLLKLRLFGVVKMTATQADSSPQQQLHQR